jgi:multisubunit Na+/H+ antiporter MnhG subunit
MMLTIGVLITVTAVFGILRLRIPARSQAANLGSMSEKWLAEQRAGHSS